MEEGQYKASTLSGYGDVDMPSAQAHTQIYSPAAEKLAEQYGLQLVDPSYFFTQERWEEHVHALEHEKKTYGVGPATSDPDEHTPARHLRRHGT